LFVFDECVNLDHALWHVFVLAGSISHWYASCLFLFFFCKSALQAPSSPSINIRFAIYFYVLPASLATLLASEAACVVEAIAGKEL
jgi:hypothetical protein